MRNRLVPHPCVVDKNLEGISWEPEVPGPLAQGSSARKINPHNFWLQKPEGIESMEKLLEP